VRALVSATIPERLRREMRPLLRDALEICPIGEPVLSSDIEHWCFYCDGRKRLDFCRRFEAALRPERCLLFMTMASRVEKSAAALAHLGLPVAAIHSGLDKEARRVALERFAAGEIRYLLTSDLGARGLDIAGISHVISLDLPEEPTIYTHRAGRTGRAGAKGVSIVLADGVELARASKIAVKGGFIFRCKVLEEGKVLEPTSEEFFSRVASFEEERMAAKVGHVGDGARRGTGKKRPSADSRRDAPNTGDDGRRPSEPRAPYRKDDTPRSRNASEGSAGRGEAPWSRNASGAKPFPRREGGYGESRGARGGERPARDPVRERRPATDRPRSERPASRVGERNFSDKPRTERAAEKPASDRTAPRAGERPTGDRPARDPVRERRPATDMPRSERPASRAGERMTGDRPRFERSSYSKPGAGSSSGARRRIEEGSAAGRRRDAARGGAREGAKRPMSPKPKRRPER
jgi:superfamily II DNA/RNA helicase